MKKVFKTLGWIMLLAFVGLQFFRPEKNRQEGVAANAVSQKYTIPADADAIMKKACYDCHTNNSEYPWYFNIQPVGIWMNKHIKDGKRHLNFSEFTNRPLWVQYHKLEEVIETVKEGEMPLNSYTWTHKDAKLSSDEKVKITSWAQSAMDSMKAWYPADSLVRPKRPEVPKS